MIGHLGRVAAGAASARDPKLYAAALDFERQLVELLAKGMQATSEPLAQDDAGRGVSELYRSQLPAALADSVRNAGGLGLAPELYRALAGGTS